MQGIDLSNAGMTAEKAKLQVIFVLGGPGSGKGTQVSPNIALHHTHHQIALPLVYPSPAASHIDVA